MSTAKGLREVSYMDIQQAYPAWDQHHGKQGFEKLGWHDCAGGGQVVVQNGIAYLGNMRNPFGTMIVDVKDPRNPKPLADISMPPGTHFELSTRPALLSWRSSTRRPRRRSFP